jgi:hypothetical protein
MMMLRALTRLFAPPYTLKRPPSKLVAIVVPLSTRPTLTADEQTSLRHLTHFLGGYDKYTVASPQATIELDGFQMKRLPGKFFGSLAAINNLWYAPEFFKAFTDYKFIFWYHLDCLVLSDQLPEWCAADLDYIGPPWIQCPDSPWVEKPRVGNGGFALVKVETFLKVLYNRYEKEPKTYWADLAARNNRRLVPFVRVLELVQRHYRGSRMVNRLLQSWNVMQNPEQNSRNSDYFWSDRAVAYLPEFKVATLEQGLRFGFEAGPRTCFEMNGRRMPFGCHAWPRYDRRFWEPFLLNENGRSVATAG